MADRWFPITESLSGTTAERQAIVVFYEGRHFFDTDTQSWWYDNGGAFVEESGGSKGVTAAGTLTEDYLVSGDTAAKAVKASTLTTAAVTDHIADATLHFTEGSVDHTAITNIGTNTHAQIDSHIADVTTNPHAVDLAGLGPGTHSALELASVDSGTIFASLQTGQVAALTGVAAASGQFVPIESAGGDWQNVDMADLLGGSGDVSAAGTPLITQYARWTTANIVEGRTKLQTQQDLDIESGVDFDPVGTDNSTDVTLANGPSYLSLAGQVLTHDPIDISSSDVTGSLPIADIAGTPVGTGNIVLETSPTIVTPTIASMTNAQHDHADAAGGGTIAYASITGTPTAQKQYMRFTIEAPVAGDDAIDLGVVDVACTIVKVYHYFRGAGTSIAWNLEHGTNPTSGANLFTSSVTTNTKTSIGSASTGFSVAALAAGESMWLNAGTLTGAVDILHLTVVYTED